MTHHVSPSLLSCALVLVASATLRADAGTRTCVQACRQDRIACVADAHTAFTTAKALCPAHGQPRRSCVKVARGIFVPARVACSATQRECRRCCHPGAAGCSSTTSSTVIALTTSTTVAPATTTTTIDTPTTTTTSLPGGACPGLGGGSAPTGFQATVHLTSAGQDRTYSLFVPGSYDPHHAYPLVLGFHGDGGTGAAIRGTLGLEAQANGTAIFAYPDATAASFRSFDLETPLASNADMTLVVDLVAALEATYCIDPHRVFATGFSRGGYFVNFLNCRLGVQHLRAIAAQSASGPYGLVAADYDVEGHVRCEATAAAALLIHGESDSTVPLSDAQYSRTQWVWADQCADSTTPFAPAPCVAHAGCAPDKPVVWCQIFGLGHAVWANAPQAVWSFFAAFP